MQVTVNIVSYRYGHLVAHAVESVLAQSKLPDVIRVIDDGVGDCRHIAELYPEIEFIERETNLGPVASFQDALDRTTTDRVLNLGADNWLRPDAIASVTAYGHDIVSYDIAICGDGAQAFALRAGAALTPSHYYLWQFRPLDIRVVNYIHGSSLFNADLAKRHKYRSSGRERSEEDWMMWQDMLGAGATHHHIPEPMLYYRRHRSNSR